MKHKSYLSSRLARLLLKTVTLNMSGLRGSLYLIEIRQHENVWLLLSLCYRLIDDVGGTCNNTWVAAILRGPSRGPKIKNRNYQAQTQVLCAQNLNMR